MARARYWLAQGAAPTPSVGALLTRIGLMPDPNNPDKIALAPVSSPHEDAAALPPSLLDQPASTRAEAVWQVTRRDGTAGQQQRRRDMLWREQRKATDDAMAVANREERMEVVGRVL